MTTIHDEDLPEDLPSKCYRTANLVERPTFPHYEETLVVVHDWCGSYMVERTDIVVEPESWGVYLHDIACVIARELAAEADMSPEGVMAEIQKG